MNRDTFVPVDARWYVANVGGVVLTGLLAAITRWRWLRWLFWAAVGVHVTEAAYAYRSARAAGFSESAPRWAAQTLGVGFPSLFALRDARTASDAELGPES